MRRRGKEYQPVPDNQPDNRRWLDIGYFPFEGASGEESISREEAKRFFRHSLTRKWERKEKMIKVAREVNRLQEIYPDVYAEVLDELDLDVEEWWRFKNSMDREREKHQNEQPTDDNS